MAGTLARRARRGPACALPAPAPPAAPANADINRMPLGPVSCSEPGRAGGATLAARRRRAAAAPRTGDPGPAREGPPRERPARPTTAAGDGWVTAAASRPSTCRLCASAASDSDMTRRAAADMAAPAAGRARPPARTAPPMRGGEKGSGPVLNTCLGPRPLPAPRPLRREEPPRFWLRVCSRSSTRAWPPDLAHATRSHARAHARRHSHGAAPPQLPTQAVCRHTVALSGESRTPPTRSTVSAAENGPCVGGGGPGGGASESRAKTWWGGGCWGLLGGRGVTGASPPPNAPRGRQELGQTHSAGQHICVCLLQVWLGDVVPAVQVKAQHKMWVVATIHHHNHQRPAALSQPRSHARTHPLIHSLRCCRGDSELTKASRRAAARAARWASSAAVGGAGAGDGAAT